ncbi:MAG: diguanylate cyclase [Spirochaetaceae bacterium]|nr:diguanylate cyclase [Spirochaetaceae bacterium]
MALTETDAVLIAGGTGVLTLAGALAWLASFLRRRERLPAARKRVLEAMGDGVVIFDPEERVVECNPAARQILDLGRDEPMAAAGAAIRRIPELVALLATGGGSAEIRSSEEAREIRIKAKAFPLLGDGNESMGSALVMSDITETSLLLDRLATLASVDPLTGTYNRRRFAELAERDLELARRTGANVGILMMDIDHFKRINDEHGHQAGDEVLRAICARCRDALRGTDIFSRYGGEEFAVLLPGNASADAKLVADRLRAKIGGASVDCGGDPVAVTVSIGAFAGVPANGEGLEAFLKRADVALYEAKAAGRDRVVSWRG